ncbi:hypothetical protein [Nonomuraea sp. NPDC049750]|uniref:hypothetical protein n=1 Tax=Nonomuraea sp. NPDC049750 TaxID=3154738 RepID=UPI0033E1785B
MATIPNPRTWGAAEAVTAAKLNTDVRDGYNFLLATPRTVMRKSANQSIPNGTLTAVTWDLEDVDTDSGHSTVTNNSRYTAQTAGWYHISATIGWANGSINGAREVFLWKNGDGSTRQSRADKCPTNGEIFGRSWVNISGHINLAVNDWVEIQVWHNSGAAMDVAGNIASFSDGNFPSLWDIRWVHT